MPKKRHIVRDLLLALFALTFGTCLVAAGALLLWAATLPLPSIERIEKARLETGTTLYDRTGEVVLYNMHQDVKRTSVALDDMSPFVRNATIAIEDDAFYKHIGIDPRAILRAIVENLKEGDLLGGQGGSTITQQIVKNSLLVREKKLSRKLKEWVLALKLERAMSKDEILELYLNIAPYGGNKYGVEEASQAFFGKTAKDLTIAESAYLAALPQAPTYYSPNGNNREALDERKDVVLKKMREQNYLSEEEYQSALHEEVLFKPPQKTSIKAPHFVFHVIDELEKKYGKQKLEEENLKVITTLDWKLQSEAERIVYDAALKNKELYNAENAAVVAVDPRSGDILTMVGSRDYFDPEIDGNYNITLANRQPGSSFKPIIYAASFLKGYTPDTILFDVRTQFSTACDAWKMSSDDGCYSPVNYDTNYRGPITMRNALAQSVNVPAVKTVYLTGVKDTIELAQKLGITTLGDHKQYGLSLALGGAEVSPLEMVSAYGVFAIGGLRAPHRSVIKILNEDGTTLEEVPVEQTRALDEQVALQITDILSDNVARTPAFGATSYLYFPSRDVAAKTGTTNDYRDAWVIGYTPTIAVGAWVGNNDNTPMEKKVAGFIVAPLWHDVFEKAFELGYEGPEFTDPAPLPSDLKPILRGRYEGSRSVLVDKVSGKLATNDTPPEFREERFEPEIHNILHWVTKDDPRGPYPSCPSCDSQYSHWEYGVTVWKGFSGNLTKDDEDILPVEEDDVHTEENRPIVTILRPKDNSKVSRDRTVTVRADVDSEFSIEKVDFFVNTTLIGSDEDRPYEITFTPTEIEDVTDVNTITATAFDEVQNRGSASVSFSLRE